jgi:FkbM family methyltransferase
MRFSVIELVKAWFLFPLYVYRINQKADKALLRIRDLSQLSDKIILGLGLDDFRGQYGQDILIDRLLGGKRQGFFVELGAYDPIELSNTFFLERNRDWTGLLVEAQPDRKDLLVRSRPNSIVESCAISDQEKEITFTLAEAISGIDDAMTPQHARRISAEFSPASVRLKTVTLQSLFDKHRITHVDYFSLDVEGAELQVLKSIDFSKVRIELLTVEIDYAELMLEIYELLQRNGFTLLGHLERFKFTPLSGMEHRGPGDYVFRYRS